MPSRRTLLAAGASAVAAGTAGCLDVIFGEEIEFEAEAGDVSESALEDTGYESAGVQDVEIEREFEAGGQSRTVSVTNKNAEFDKSIDLSDTPLAEDAGEARAAVFSVFTSPQVSVLDRQFNPIADMDTAEIAEQAQNRYEGLDDLERTRSEDVTVLGEETVADRFVGQAQLADSELEVDTVLWITESVESAEDHVVLVCGYPEPIESIEEENFFTMVEGVEHGG